MTKPHTASDLVHSPLREIVALHDFFQSWFTGTCANNDETYAYLVRAFHPAFQMVTADGKSLTRAHLLSALRTAYGTLGDTFNIRITDIDELWRSDDAYLMGYCEWQRTDKGVTVRKSSALFVPDPASDSRLLWRYVHETWMPTPNSMPV